MTREKCCYLLLKVGAGLGCSPSKSNKSGVPVKPYPVLSKAVNDFSDYLQTPFWIAPFHTEGSSQDNYRFFFRFKNYARDDNFARRISESIIFSTDFLQSCYSEYLGEGLFFYFPKTIKLKSFDYKEIVKKEESSRPWERPFVLSINEICSCSFIPDWVVAEGLEIAKLCLKNNNILQALIFLHKSSENFYVESVDIQEAIVDGEKNAVNGLIQNKWEISVQNAFKAIEAVIGDPPSNDKKFFQKLNNAGIDPYHKVGFREKIPLYEAVRKLGKLRDKKAAHGSTPSRSIKLNEMLDCQACREAVIWLSIEHLLGRKINLEARKV